ncbi:MAG: threonine--tRNA ligase [Planctomycetota bacterium]
MARITLPDGSVKEFDGAVTAYQVAESIGSRLAQQSVGARINGELSDIHAMIEGEAELSIITSKPRDEQQRDDLLYLMRHSAAHVMAEAIQRIVPGAQLVYGPPLETGFYYDIRFPEDRPLSSEDFEAIEAECAKIIKEDRPFTRYELPVAEGMEKLKGEGSKYKIDNAERAVEAGSDELSWYATGEPGTDWEDLCRGPHVPSTGRIGAMKVMSLASSYWHGDEKSDSLTRVYGTAFPSKKELDEHLERLEQAKQRDHRVIGRKLGLFHIDEMVGQGLVLWTPKGAVIRNELQEFISDELRKQGYHQVFTPHIGKLDLYRTSGHFPYYQDSQYPPIPERDVLIEMAEEGCTCGELTNRLEAGEAEGYMLKPMNCPHHIRIFKSQPHSYRDLPVRLAEFGTVYRWEQSGELSGMTRVRGFTQDDAHLFCTEEQVAEELKGCLSLVRIIFSSLGMDDYRVRVGLRDPDSSKYVGEPAKWDKAEQACRDAAASLDVPFSEEPGEAAFYGPKIDFVVKDVIGREWQLGTVQVDYNLPERFGLEYIGADNQPHRPVMIHRAPFGSMERFVGVLIEHFEGAFPLWLSPEQVRVLPISEKSNAYASEVHAMLSAAGLRTTLDTSDSRVQGKIKVAADERIPYLAVVGPRDAEQRAVSVRARGVQKDLGSLALDAFVAKLVEERETRGSASLRASMTGE